LTFVTLDQVRAAARARGVTASAITELREAAAASMRTQYDFFLSHSHEDALAISGVKAMLEAERWTVYVYWAEGDATARVDAATAQILRTRMNNCKAFIYASSDASPTSRWMPWELGYFDGRKPGRIAIMPLRSSASARFQGQEYLKLYPNVEEINWSDRPRSLGIFVGDNTARPLSGFITHGATVYR
jgi:hypothetical protein